MASQKVYVSVKSYGQKGKLLTRQDLQTLAEARDLEELLTRIKNTVYADVVSNLVKPYTSEAIEQALRSHLADVHYSMAKTSGGSEILDAYYTRFLIWNLKLILKGKVLGKTQEEIEPHLNLHAEELIKQRDIIVKALVAKDLEETVSSLSSIKGGDEIAKAVALYNEKKNIQIFDIYFDKILYKRLGRAIKSTSNRDVQRLVGMDVDFYNLLSVIRGKFWGLEEAQIQDLIVAHTPSISRDLLTRMITANSIKDAWSELAQTRYRSLVPQSESELDAISEFEQAFEMSIFRAANSSFTKMFNFATVIGITKLVSYEVRNIAAIAYAVEQGIPVDTTMSKIIAAEKA